MESYKNLEGLRGNVIIKLETFVSARIVELQRDMEQGKEVRDFHTIQGALREQRAFLNQLKHLVKA